MTVMNQSNFTDLLLFKDFLIKKGLRESSIELYCDVIDSFMIIEPDYEDIDSYNNFLKEHSYKKRSNYYYYAIKLFLKFKIEDLSLRNNLLRNLIVPKNNDPIRSTVYLTDAKRLEIISRIKNEKHKIIALLQYKTGARVGDILRLQRGAISFENHENSVVMKIDLIGKGGKRIPKYIFERELQDYILKWVEDNFIDEKYYFMDHRKAHKRSTETVIYRTNYIWYWMDLKEACKQCNIDHKKWATHDFRRSISRDIWNDKEMGKDVQLLQNFLGHARAETTLRYIKHSGLGNIEVSKRMSQRKTE